MYLLTHLFDYKFKMFAILINFIFYLILFGHEIFSFDWISLQLKLLTIY